MTFNPGEKCLTGSQRPMLTERDVKNYTCPVGITRVINGTEFTNSSFNEGNQGMGWRVRSNEFGYEWKHFQQLKFFKRFQ